MPRRVQSLRAVPLGDAAQASFCSHCGRPPGEAQGRVSRICGLCEMGLLLRAVPQLAPEPGDAFLVTDEQLLVCALSQGAERLLGRAEPAVIQRPLAQLLKAATTDENGLPALAAMMRMAAAGRLDCGETVVIPVDGTGDRYRARVGACGPPAAALLVFDEPLP